MRAAPFVRIVPVPALLLGLLASTASAAQIDVLKLDTPDGSREALVAHQDHASSAPRALVLVLHGHGGTARNAMGQGARPSPLSAWLAVVDREDVVVAALQGLEGSDRRAGWNDCRSQVLSNPHGDDVGFAEAVLARLRDSLNIDPARVYAMGMSNGAMMVQRLALEMKPPLAAIAAVSGSLAAQSSCRRPTRGTSVLLIHGTADPIVPYAGGEVSILGRARGAVLSVEDTLRFWLTLDGLDPAAPPRIQRFPPHGSASSAQLALYGGGAMQVGLIRVEGGGHIEPSLAYHYGALYEKLVGPQNQDLESVEEAWRFFRDRRAGTAP